MQATGSRKIWKNCSSPHSQRVGLLYFYVKLDEHLERCQKFPSAPLLEVSVRGLGGVGAHQNEPSYRRHFEGNPNDQQVSLHPRPSDISVRESDARKTHAHTLPELEGRKDLEGLASH